MEEERGEIWLHMLPCVAGNRLFHTISLGSQTGIPHRVDARYSMQCASVLARAFSRVLKKSASVVLASFRPSTGTRPPHQLGGAHRLGAPYSSHPAPQKVRLGPSLAAALLGTKRVSARLGWEGEKSGLFEHPAGVFSCCVSRLSSSQAHVRAIEVLACHNSFSAAC